MHDDMQPKEKNNQLTDQLTSSNREIFAAKRTMLREIDGGRTMAVIVSAALTAYNEAM